VSAFPNAWRRTSSASRTRTAAAGAVWKVTSSAGARRPISAQSGARAAPIAKEIRSVQVAEQASAKRRETTCLAEATSESAALASATSVAQPAIPPRPPRQQLPRRRLQPRQPLAACLSSHRSHVLVAISRTICAAAVAAVVICAVSRQASRAPMMDSAAVGAV
jgi:hypothetical protein